VMTILVNGNTHDIEEERTLEELLLEFEISKEMKGIAVALNDDVIPKKMWSDTKVQSSDRIEIIRAVQGG